MMRKYPFNKYYLLITFILKDNEKKTIYFQVNQFFTDFVARDIFCRSSKTDEIFARNNIGKSSSISHGKK